MRRVSDLSVSLSKSLQSSLIVRADPALAPPRQQQQQHYHQQHQQTRHHQVKQRQEVGQSQGNHEEVDEGVGVVGKMALVAAMCSVEACMAFEHVYLILMLQYLGTPVYLMSSPGVLTGITSLIIIPGLGYCSNNGTDPWKRKMYSIIFGMAVFLSGLLLMIIAGIIKLREVSKVLGDLAYLDSISSFYNLGNTSNASEQNITSFIYTDVPNTAILGIVGFGLTDVAYDVAAPVLRSFALDTLPTHQHSAVLATATVMQGFGGTAMTIIGVFDLPAIIGAAFNVDGMAGTLLLLCGILVLIVIASFSVTLVSGYVIGGNRGKRGNTNLKTKTCGSENQSNLNFTTVKGSSNPSNVPTMHEHFQHKPILTPEKTPQSQNSIHRAIDRFETALDFQISQNEHSKTHINLGPTKEESNSVLADEKAFLIPIKENERVDSHSSLKRNNYNERNNQSQIDTISTHVASSGDVSQEVDRNAAEKHSLLKNKSFVITCVSCFFANGCLLAFSVYSANALTIGILKGNPLAFPGVPERELYVQGMRTAAFGTFLLYVSTLVSSVCSHKVIQLTGERAYYLAICTIVSISIAAFVGTKVEKAYIVAMVIFGSFRSASLTVPFMLASRLVTEETKDAEDTERRKTLGSAISLLGLMMPAHYLVLSSCLGPLIDLTGDVWVPVVYSLVVLLASALTLALLYWSRGSRK